MTVKEKVIQIYREVLEGKRTKFPYHFFVGTQGKKVLADITRHLIEEYLDIHPDEIPDKVKAETLWKHRLRPAALVHGWNFIDVIENAYPGRFKPWEFNQVSFGYWQGEEGRKRAIKAVRYIIEEKCKIPHDEIPRKINYRFFKDHGLVGILRSFGNSPYQVIHTVYPDRFQPWEFATVPMNYWKNPENVKQAMDGFLFQKLSYSSYQEALQKLTKKQFFQYRLTGLFQMAFDQRLLKVKQWIVGQIDRKLGIKQKIQ